jgi:hypothetical protein
MRGVWWVASEVDRMRVQDMRRRRVDVSGRVGFRMGWWVSGVWVGYVRVFFIWFYLVNGVYI